MESKTKNPPLFEKRGFEQSDHACPLSMQVRAGSINPPENKIVMKPGRRIPPRKIPVKDFIEKTGHLS